MFAVVSMAAASQAATLTFGPTGWTDQAGDDRDTEWTVIVSDVGVGAGYDYRVSASYSGGTNTGDIGGVALAVDGALTGVTTNLVSAIAVGGTDITHLINLGQCLGEINCGGGANFSGGGNPLTNPFNTLGMDFTAETGSGSSEGVIQTLIFDVNFDPDVGPLSASLFPAVALRLQTFGTAPDDGDDSAKLFATGGTLQCPPGQIRIGEICGPKTTDDPGVVPLPAGLPLMLTVIGVGAYMRKRARKSA
ncbi:hypothetical protein [Tateyamaria sp.]|jgi:hypothetical protein|uniref:hypothetical protein n=1 Tax=Tateyamaria sp. TaxID=1929288 RepID=UPI0032DC5075